MIQILRTFYAFVLKKRLVAIIFILLVILSPLVQSLLPYFLKLFVDAISSLNYQQLLTILVVYMGIYLLGRILHTLMYFLGDVLTFDAGKEIRVRVFRHILDLDFAFHTNKSSGSLISILKRGDSAFWDIHHSLHFEIISVAIQFLVMMYFFAELDMRIFFMALISVVASLLLTKVFVKVNIRTRKKFNEEEDKISGVIVDNMVNFETVKLFAKESWERQRLVKHFVSWKKALWAFSLSFRYLDIGMALVAVVSIFSMLFVSLQLTVNGAFTPGDFILVVGFTSSFYPQLFQLVWGIRRIAKNYTDLEKYFGVLDQVIAVDDPKDPQELGTVLGEIVYKNVSFSYEKKERNAIKNINFTIRPGQSVALVGRSGAGKTTLVKLLMRFFDVTNGAITIDGVDIKNMSKSYLRSLMGVVPQEPVLFNHSIAYNIAYGKPKASRQEIEAAAKLANIHDFIKRLPKGYKTQVGERGVKLSGGQKQRVAIARMILSNPDIVIFDEATSQLDSESEKLIQDAFWKAVYNKTTIIIAHRLSTIKRADKIVVMERGQIVEVGSHNELLLKDKGLYKYFWGLQGAK